MSKAKDRFPNYESICLQCGATIYKPYRELTDAEIWEVISHFSFKDLSADLIKFARAIQKASEK